jgi:hypothetical protein
MMMSLSKLTCNKVLLFYNYKSEILLLDEKITFKKLLQFACNFWDITNRNMSFVNSEGNDYSNMFGNYCEYLSADVSNFIDTFCKINIIVLILQENNVNCCDFFISVSNVVSQKVCQLPLIRFL